MPSWEIEDQRGQRWLVTWLTPEREFEAGERRAEAVCVTGDGQVLLVRSRAGGCDCPGGRIEEGETALETMIREAREEASVDVTIAEPIGLVRADCLAGDQAGWVMRTDMFVARVKLRSWQPASDETMGRIVLNWGEAERVWNVTRPERLDEYARLLFGAARKRIAVV